jgi:hypothetical protein
MKRFLLPLAVCAALAGCADYGTVAYGSYPAYSGYPAYATSPYAYDYAYGPYGPGPGWVYGGPNVALGFGGTVGDYHHRYHDRGWHGGEHHGSAAYRAGTHAMGAGPGRFGHRGPGTWHGGGHVAGHHAGPRAGGDHDEHHHG